MFNVAFFQNQVYYLSGAGVVIGDNQVVIENFVDIYGNLVDMTYFGNKGWFTIEQGTPNERQQSFTGVTQNGNGTATLTGVQTVFIAQPYTETANFDATHAGGTTIVFSNNPGLYQTFANKQNTGTVIATWTFSAFGNNANPKIDSNSYVPVATDYITRGFADATYATIVSSGVTQIIAGAGISISPLGGTGIVTITNTGGGGGGPVPFGDAGEYKFAYGSVDSGQNHDDVGAVWFPATGGSSGGINAPYLLATVFNGPRTVNPHYASLTQAFGADPNTGTISSVNVGAVDFADSISVSTDGLSLYTLAVTVTNSGHTFNQAIVTLKQYDNTFTLIQTSTGTFTQGFNDAYLGAFITSTFFVQGSHLVCMGLGSSAGFGQNFFATDLTISGATLINPVQTNVQIGTFPNVLTSTYDYATGDGTYVYLQQGNTVYKQTYVSPTFTGVSSHGLAIPDASPCGNVVGFTPFSSTIGKWRNTSVVSYIESTPANQYSSAIYGIYTF